MSNEIRYLYPLYLIIVMVGYRNILEFAFNLKYKKLLNIKLTFLTIFLLFLFTLIFNKNIKNYSQFLDSISYKKINILNDPDDIKPKFNQKIVDFFKKENLNKNDIILTNYYILPYLNIPALSKINKKIIYSNFENFKNIDKPNYIIVFKNCIDFDTKYKKELDLKKVIIEDNSCIFKKFNQ